MEYPAHEKLKNKLCHLKMSGAAGMTISNRVQADEILTEFDSLLSEIERLRGALEECRLYSLDGGKLHDEFALQEYIEKTLLISGA